MSTKPVILVFIDWFWPGYLAGGPVQSMISLVNYLGAEVDFKIVTTNRDLNQQKPYEGISPNTWIQSPLGCEVYYAEPESLNVAEIKRIIDETQFDKVYINSFFSKYFSIVPLQILNAHYPKKPVILAPRGMLGEGALAIKKFKKKLFLLYAKLTGLHKNVWWHATSAQEEKEIRTNFPAAKRITTISNLPKLLKASDKKQKSPGKLDLCFISRISEKKNLVFALEILSEVRGGEVIYNIYGPLEDQAYWARCTDLIAKLPPNVKANYKGSIDPNELENVLEGEHVMLLPTLNENFGHSIVESLLCGCPVIISDQTPWTDLEAHHAGYAIALSNKQKFIDAIAKAVAMDQEAFSESSAAAIKYISKKIDLGAITLNYKTLFNE